MFTYGGGSANAGPSSQNTVGFAGGSGAISDTSRNLVNSDGSAYLSASNIASNRLGENESPTRKGKPLSPKYAPKQDNA